MAQRRIHDKTVKRQPRRTVKRPEGLSLLALREHPELNGRAAAWFHALWGVPEAAYLDSFSAGQTAACAVPQWYLLTDGAGAFAAGIGVIENDFHDCPDLAPNICAVYVRPDWRGRGVARWLLEYVCGTLAAQGIEDIYLMTGHRRFYERCGWGFYCMVREADGGVSRLYHRKTGEKPARCPHRQTAAGCEKAAGLSTGGRK